MYGHLHGRLVTSRFASRCLANNVLGDPHERDVLVYLPPGYAETSRRYPAVFMLPGFAATHYSVLGYSPWEPNTVERFDAMIANESCPPAILVLPDCMTRWGGSQFLDSPATGRYQTYLADEVVPYVDAAFRTIPRREARAFVGRSSGGFGALRLAMDRPDVLSVVASHAGDAAFDLSMRPMLHHAAIAIEAAGGLTAFLERVAHGGPRGGFDFDAIFVVACSAAYAPESDSPLPHCALPFDARTGTLRPEIWQRWLAHDPLLLVPSRVAALGQMALLCIDAGSRDEHGLGFAARLLGAALIEAGARVRVDEFDGGHRGTSHRYGVSLPAVIGALESA